MVSIASTWLACVSCWQASVSAEIVSPHVSQCLRDGLPKIKRRFLTSNEAPLGIWMLDWPSSQIVARVFTIFAEEVHGVHVEHFGPGRSSSTSVYALAGCHAPEKYHADPDCRPNARDGKHQGHLSFEVWETAFRARLESLRERYPQIAPRVIGSIGYAGKETLFVTQNLYSECYRKEGLPLDFYASYDSTWHFTSKYFDPISSFPSSVLQWCSETMLRNQADMKNYVLHTEDVGGTEVGSGGSVQGKCLNGTWWLAPACRSEPDSCIPLLTGGDGWFLDAFMHAAYKYSMPFALATARNWTVYTNLPKQHKILFYWWTPDPTFLFLSPRRVVFADFDSDAWEEGDKSSVSTNVELLTLGHSKLESLDKAAFDMARSFKFSDRQITGLLTSTEESGSTYQETACAWMQVNRAVWEKWVPDATACVLGQGLVDPDGVFRKNRSLAVACQWCSAGYFSKAFYDMHGSTHICVSCHPGFHQPKPGKASCKSCLSGTYSDGNASQHCKRCAAGRFQPEEGASSCVECPQPMTTLGYGANTLQDCVCPSETIQDEVGHCQPCPDGLDCKVASTIESVSCDSSLAAIRESQTKLFPSYMSHCSNPLSVYRCLSIEACPGGDIGQCARGFEGIACGECKKGFTYRGGCVECDDRDKSLFIIFLATLAFISPMLIIAAHCLTAHAGTNLRPRIWDFNSCIAQLFLTIAEVVATCASCDLSLNEGSEFLSKLYYILRPLDLLHPNCVEGLSFQVLFLIHLLTPVGAASIFVLTYSLSALISRVWSTIGLDWNICFGIYGSLCLIFSISIFQRGTSWFQCYEHPNHEWTLRIAPNILCYGDDWRILAVVSFLAMMLFTVGGLTTLIYSVWYAPVLIDKACFRKRWRFMFVKFRATAYWWGLVLVAQGLWLSLVVVVSSNSAVQLFLICLILVLYSCICCVVVPWRHAGIWLLDVFSHALLTLLCATLFTDRRPAKDDVSTASAMSWVLFLSPFVLGLVVVAVHIWLSSRHNDFDYHSQATALASGLSQVHQVEVVASILKRLPLYDVLQLMLAKNLLEAEVSVYLNTGTQLSRGISPSPLGVRGASTPEQLGIVPEAFVGKRRLSFRSDSVQPQSPDGSVAGDESVNSLTTARALAALREMKSASMEMPGMLTQESEGELVIPDIS